MAIAEYAALVRVDDKMVKQVRQHHARFVNFGQSYPDKMKFPDPFPGWPNAAVR